MAPFVHLHLRPLVRRPSRLVLSIVALVAGTAVTISMLSISASVTEGAAIALGDRTDADLVVTGLALTGVPTAIVGQVEATPGVETTASLLRQPATIAGGSGTLLGAEFSAAEFASLPAGCVEMTGSLAERGVILGPGVHPRKSTVAISSGTAGIAEFPVSGRATCDAAREIDGGAFALADLATAQTLSGREGMADAILIRLAQGADPSATVRALDDRLAGSVLVGTPDEVAAELAGGLSSVVGLLGLVTTLAIIVAGFLVFNTFSMLAQQRQREFATLRALGARRSGIIVRTLGEAAAVGLLAAVLGVGVGIAGAGSVVGALPPVLLGTVGAPPVVVVPQSAIVIGVLVGIASAVVGAVLPAIAATRLPPASSLRPRGPLDDSAGDRESNRPLLALAAGTGLVIAAAVGIVGSGTVAMPAVSAIQVCFVVLTFALSGSIARLAGVSVAGLGGLGAVASEAVRRAPRRTFGTVVAVALGVAIVATAGGARADQNRSSDAAARDVVDSPITVQVDRLGDLPTQRLLPEDLLDAIEREPGVRSLVRGQATYAAVGGRRVLFEGFDGDSNYPIPAATSEEAWQQLVAGTGAVVNRRFAELHDLEVGSELTVPTSFGTESIPIVEVIDVYDIGGGSVGVPLAWFERTFGRRGANWAEVYVHDDSPAERARVAEVIRSLVDRREANIEVGTGEEVFAAIARVTRESSQVLLLVALLIAACASVAVANTLTLTVLQRRREFAISRAIGATRTTIAGIVALEAVALAAGGAVIGVVLGAVGHRITANLLSELVGTTIPYRFNPGSLVTGVGAAVVIGLIGAAVGTWRLAKTSLQEGLSYE